MAYERSRVGSARNLERLGTIKFLGTAGARFVTTRQLRASGGILISYLKTRLLIDPGPGSLVHMLHAQPKLNPANLTALILTHKHIDHSSDINIMIEAMTEGGRNNRGILCAPADAFGASGVIFSYLEKFPEKIIRLKTGKMVRLGDISMEVISRLKHPVETYGLRFMCGKKTIALISDTDFHPKLLSAYRADIVLMNVVFKEKKQGIAHLCMDDAKRIIRALKPKKAFLTHFGLSMIKENPYRLGKQLSRELNVPVYCAYDQMNIYY